MSIATKCSHCGASYNLNDQMRGKTVRCKGCQETFLVAAAAGGQQVQAGRTTPRPAAAPPSPGKKGSPNREKTSPTAKKSSTGKVLLIVGGVVGLGLVVCCGGPAAVFLYFGYQTTSEVKNLQAKAEADWDKALKEQQAAMNGQQPPFGQGNPAAGGNPARPPLDGGAKVQPPPGFRFGQEPQNIDEALTALRGTDEGQRGIALNWLAKQPVDKARQGEVARAVEALLSSNASRTQAVHALKTWADKDSLPALAKVLNDGKPGPTFPGDATQEAMATLARFPDPRGAEAVARYATNAFAGDPAVASLQTMGKEVAEAAALKYYHDPDGGRERVRKLLQGFGTTESAIAQQSATDLKSRQVDTRRLAAEWLGQVRQSDPAVRDQVAKGLEETLGDRDNGVAERSAQALAVWGGKENVPALTRVVDDQTGPGNVRQQAILALGRIPDEKAAAALCKCLNGNQRGEAARALQTQGAVAEKELVKYVNDPTANRDGRDEATRILKMIGSKENVAVTAAVADLKDNDTGRRMRGAETLGKMPAIDKAKQADVAAALEAALKDSEQGVRERAAKALILWATPDNVGGLLKGVDDQNHWVRVHSMMALGKLHEESAVGPVAKRLLVGEDRRDASAALQALGPKAEKTVLQALSNPEKDVRMEACKILKVIGTNNKTTVNTLTLAFQQCRVLKRADEAEAVLLALQEIKTR
jgi:predicted Zn finger-like uncharacterized protein